MALFQCVLGLLGALAAASWNGDHTERETEGERERDCDDIQVDLLQKHVLLTGSSIQIPKPIYWLHIAKTNSGFGTALLTLPTMCSNASEQAKEIILHPRRNADPEKRVIFEDECRGDIMDLRLVSKLPHPLPKHGDHSGIGSFYPRLRGHMFTILRQPEQRIMSGWHDSMHSWPSSFGHDPQSMKEYARVVAGCAVKMLTRDGASEGRADGGPPGDPGALRAEQMETLEPVATDLIPHFRAICADEDLDGSFRAASDAEVVLAKRRLRDGFAFVGILEEWPLSLCLLHTMYGGRCNQAELGEAGTWYNTTALNGFVDKADGMLYEVGQQIFREHLRQYGVSTESCDCS